SEILAPPSFPLIRHVFSLSGRKKTKGWRSGHLKRVSVIAVEVSDTHAVEWPLMRRGLDACVLGLRL
ncbi:MAG: hypothetical protein MUC77_20555, partial [Chromatiaceae bacterium]|nr:hypothetical protein [Chromatiaceae bacterium]